MFQRYLAPGLILFGLCVLALGASWNRVTPTSAYWSDEQAEEFTKAQTELHAKWHTHDVEHKEEDFAAAKDRFIKVRDELESARNSHGRTGKILLIAGVGFALVGIFIHYSAGRQG